MLKKQKSAHYTRTWLR